MDDPATAPNTVQTSLRVDPAAVRAAHGVPAQIEFRGRRDGISHGPGTVTDGAGRDPLCDGTCVERKNANDQKTNAGKRTYGRRTDGRYVEIKLFKTIRRNSRSIEIGRVTHTVHPAGPDADQNLISFFDSARHEYRYYCRRRRRSLCAIRTQFSPFPLEDVHRGQPARASVRRGQDRRYSYFRVLFYYCFSCGAARIQFRASSYRYAVAERETRRKVSDKRPWNATVLNKT